MIERRIDAETGIIHVTASGIWTRADVDAHYAALRELFVPIREAGRVVRLLSDVRQGQRQTPDIEAYVLEQMRRSFLPGDRIVILTPEAEKLHVRAILRDVAVAAFSSLLPAEMWLLSDDLPKIA